MTRSAIIIGAGPAGLTAALELLNRTDIIPIVLEASSAIGGLSRTVNYKGNRMDIGGHRFFSKSDRVMSWWQQVMPIQGTGNQHGASIEIAYQGKLRRVDLGYLGPDPDREDAVMLVRERLSRIYFLRSLFKYPLSIDVSTVRKLGIRRLIRIAFSYLQARLRPRPERSLEDFFINRFGRELYETFFRSYTEKVWGVPCTEIEPEWGAQRVKGLSVASVAADLARKLLSRDVSISQKSTETSLIERFLYPKYGPGQMWQLVADLVVRRGGKILLSHEAQTLTLSSSGHRVVQVTARNSQDGSTHGFSGDFVISTMPVKDLVRGMQGSVPEEVRRIASSLVYRDFITVGLLVRKLKLASKGSSRSVTDNWIYIQESDVRLGRLQIFNNWSPYMIADREKIWLGLEYFCSEGDDLWRMSDDAIATFAIGELAKLDIVDPGEVVDHTVVRVLKTYPSYTGAYREFGKIRTFTDGIANLYLVGRNGMHRYNNQDHSMLAAMAAVDNIQLGLTSKENIWRVNTEDDYHETATVDSTLRAAE